MPMPEGGPSCLCLCGGRVCVVSVCVCACVRVCDTVRACKLARLSLYTWRRGGRVEGGASEGRSSTRSKLERRFLLAAVLSFFLLWAFLGIGRDA